MFGFTLTASVPAPKPRPAVADPFTPSLDGKVATPLTAPRMVRFGFGSHLTVQPVLVTVKTDPPK